MRKLCARFMKRMWNLVKFPVFYHGIGLIIVSPAIHWWIDALVTAAKYFVHMGIDAVVKNAFVLIQPQIPDIII